MSKHSWNFKYQVEDLLVPCTERINHHKERETHYETELAAAEKDLRENGITMKENLASLISGNITGLSHQHQPTFDQTKVQRINDCKQKLCDHRNRIVEYTKWLNAFKVALATGKETAKTIELCCDDVEFFHLAKEAV